MNLKIKNKEVRDFLEIDAPEFPKYATQILNLANQNAQGTRPKVVGQMSELIQQFKGKSLLEWEKWYIEGHPEAIKNASQKVSEMVANLKDVISKIDNNMIEKWVKELVIVQTFLGLKFQEAILKKVAIKMGAKHRLSTPQEESKGIDGYIDETAISIKPSSYKTKNYLQEKLPFEIIFYTKLKDSIEIEFEDFRK